MPSRQTGDACHPGDEHLRWDRFIGAYNAIESHLQKALGVDGGRTMLLPELVFCTWARNGLVLIHTTCAVGGTGVLRDTTISSRPRPLLFSLRTEQ